MAELSIPNSFRTGQVVSGPLFNQNYDAVKSFINDRNQGNESWDRATISRSGGVPLTADNSSGTQSIYQGKDGGSVVYEVFDGGFITASGQTYCRAYKTSNQAVAAGEDAPITFDTVSQAGSGFSTSTSRFTAPAVGKYLIDINVVGSSALLGSDITFFIRKNGSAGDLQSFFNYSSTACVFKYMDILNLSSGDYLTANVLGGILPQGAITINSGSSLTHFSVMRLS